MTTTPDVKAAMRHLNAAGITVRSLAADLNVAPSTVYRWRAGRSQPTEDNRKKLLALVDHLIREAAYGLEIIAAGYEQALADARLALDPPEMSDEEFRARYHEGRTANPQPDPALAKLVAAIHARNRRQPVVAKLPDPFAAHRNNKADEIDAAFAA